LVFGLAGIALASTSSPAFVQAGESIGAAIAKASPGDAILVGPGQYGAFTVDRPLIIQGVGMPTIKAGIQCPAIAVESDHVNISGFSIKGTSSDSTSKFNYLIENRDAQMELDLPDAAIMVEGDYALLENMTIFGAEVGIYADLSSGLEVRNVSFESCMSGMQILRGRDGVVESCTFKSCNRYGADLEGAENMTFARNKALKGGQFGIFLKESRGCLILDNLLSENLEGLALWDSNENEVRGNIADHNYYGILVSGSNNNTIIDNRAEENSRSEIVSGFGMGISLQDNSSENIVARNLVKKNFNGLELTRGCQFNVIYSNEARENKHGIRVDKNYNNLIFHNNFIKNTISAYDNDTHNAWNGSVGNYYSDYRGKDADGDSIGDQPYLIPKGSSVASDMRPLTMPCDTSELDLSYLRAEVKKITVYVPAPETPISIEGGVLVIRSRTPTSPPSFGAGKMEI
jgi:nitrous oxidase accessory protein